MWVDLRGVFHVGTAAKVDKIARFVDGDGHFFVGRVAVVIQLTALEPFDQLQLISLVFKQVFSLAGRNLFADEVFFGLDQFLHALFDAFEVIGGERTRQVEVVIKAIFDRRPYGDLSIGEHLQNCFSHYMRG